MKEIAFFIHDLGIGGIEKSLVNLINDMSENEFEVTIYSSGDDRRICKQFKRAVKIEKINLLNENIRNLFIKELSLLNINKCLNLLKLAKEIKKNENSIKCKKALVNVLDVLENEYDIAVFYSLPTRYELLYVLKKVKAKEKVAWVHMDLTTYKGRIEEFEDIYYLYDRLVCVSEFCKKKCEEILPRCKNSIIVKSNKINIEDIIKKSNEYKVEKAKDIFMIFTCSRLSHEKQPDLAVELLSELLKKGYNVCWIWAGSGPLLNNIKNRINSNELNRNFILLGDVDNPYPYYKNCDLYVQLSLNESYCISLAEAKALECNILTTNFPSAYEILEDERTCICNNNKLALLEEIENRIVFHKT